MADERLVRWLYKDYAGKRRATSWTTVAQLARDIAYYQEVEAYERETQGRQTMAYVDQSGAELDDEIMDELIDAEVELINLRRVAALRAERENPPPITYYEWNDQEWEEE